VLFAGDVGPYRLALVDAPEGGSRDVGSAPAWYFGAAGAPPDRMQPSRTNLGSCAVQPPGCAAAPIGTGSLPDAVSLVLDGRSLDADAVPGVRRGNRAVVVVVPLRPVNVTLEGPPRYAADGTVSHPRGTPLPESHGARQAVITTGGRHRLVVGNTPSEQVTAEVWADLTDAPHFPVQDAAPSLHGGVMPPRHEVQGALLAVQNASGLAVNTSRRRLLWAGTFGGRRHGVLAVTAPGGAHVVGVFRQLGAPAEMGTWLTAGAVLPAGPLEDVAVAWHNPLPERTGEAGDPRPSGQIAAVGPAGATSATFVDADGRPLATTALTDGFGMATAPGTRSVRFADATGRVVTTVPVRPLLTLDDHDFDR
jgi:hypothetical protein